MPVLSFVPSPEFVWPPRPGAVRAFAPPPPPATSFVQSPTFVWPAPPKAEPVVRAPAPPRIADPIGAARQLLRAFDRVQKANPAEWRVRIAVASGYSGVTPLGRTGCWWLLGSRDVHECPVLFFTGTPAEVPGLDRLCRTLWHCRRLVKRLDPTDTRGAVLAQLLARVLAARWAAGPFEAIPDGRHRIAVAYPTDLLAALREWIEAAPVRAGRKPDPANEAIGRRCDEMRQEGQRWKGMVAPIAAEFGVTLKSESLRKLRARWKRSTKTGTE